MEEDKFQYYLDIGAVELVGVDKDGEMIFKISETCQDVAPELWMAHQEHIDKTLVSLLEQGLINVTYNENLEALIEVSAEGKMAIKQMGLIDFPDDIEDIPNN
jgi:hypothetical protein